MNKQWETPEEPDWHILDIRDYSEICIHIPDGQEGKERWAYIKLVANVEPGAFVANKTTKIQDLPCVRCRVVDVPLGGSAYPFKEENDNE